MHVTVLFIQGAGDMHQPEGSIHLARYLERELGDQYRVLAPEIPDAETDPRYVPWRDAIDRELDAIDGPVLIVGHSLGGTVVLRMLVESPAPTEIRGLFLASMPWWGPEAWDMAEYGPPDGFGAWLPDVPIFLYHSIDDPHVPFGHLARYQAALPTATARSVPGSEHSFRNGLPELIRDIEGVSA